MGHAEIARWGALFDWDGVVVDSSAAHERSWELLAYEERRALPEGHFKRGFGKRNEVIIPEILGWTREPSEVHRLGLRKEALYREVVAERGVIVLPGAREWLTALAAAGVPCVIGSSTHRANIELICRETGLGPFFLGMVTSEDVTRSKPDPEVFLKAAALAGREPRRCVVFEDAFAGLEAARAGGMLAIGVASTHPAAALAPHADRVVTRLDELSVAELGQLLEGR